MVKESLKLMEQMESDRKNKTGETLKITKKSFQDKRIVARIVSNNKAKD